MSCATVCLKCLVVLCNLLIAVIGLVILAGGIFLLTGAQHIINQYISMPSRPNSGEVSNSTNHSSGGGGDGGGGSSIDFTPFTYPFGIVLVVFGTFIALIGLIGIFGVCCSSRVLLVIYAIVTILLIIAEIVIAVLFFVHAFDDRIRSQAQSMLTEHYVDVRDPGQDSVALAWNYMMKQFNCCGIDSYKDFKSANKWPSNESDRRLNGTQLTPFACCKPSQTYQGESDLTCSTNPTNETSNWQTGCWDKVAADLLPYRTATIGIISVIIIAQALLALMASLIAWRLPKNWKNL